MEKTVAIIVASDTRSSGINEDLTGPAAKREIEGLDLGVSEVVVIADDIDALSQKMITLSDKREITLILTCGGTGLAPRDVTPEATIGILERAVPGIPQMLRQKSLNITPFAALSRAVCGIRNDTLIINLPGSPKAVVESIGFLKPILNHALRTLAGKTSECARK